MPAEPTTPKGRRTRDHLVNAGRAVFARNGYVDARMSDVAEEADISMGGLYRYFKNKEDLFAQVIEDLHQRLYDASVARDHDFRTDPHGALIEANRGYLSLYNENRDVMRAFIQAAHVEDRFQQIWRHMRERHVDRFTAALEKVHGITQVAGTNARLATESMACMVEQSAYVWFAKAEDHLSAVDVDTAARLVAHTWHRTFFTD
ncbi:TetR/AcrR family transcriptional regulator [Gordonia sp. HY002]|uniref:TetR/AcrR family transcriptional regulator n=1 Tax=Gordonia zhenghanii TaxID=2911516 RepID=UPI001EF13642|nr:TetR/AcrR family transcriptional regulator [Gordonia zhenghanii]MCF8570383.1 TetR/AcrR family transcriptional regulator [Gordonia zhenghanii]MCF8604613.1 TetR/AcrR family transcriptional regulator [Gordonia zhenghanii]